MHSSGAARRKLSFSFRGCLRTAGGQDADVSQQHGWESHLDWWRGEGAAAALDCDCH